MKSRPTLRERIEAYAREEYGIEPEQLPFNHEDYAVLRHPDNGKWFAVFFVKPRAVLGLPGEGDAEVASFKVRDRRLMARLSKRPGFLGGYPSPRWNWLSAVLDGTIPFRDIRACLADSYSSTLHQPPNMRVVLKRRHPKENTP